MRLFLIKYRTFIVAVVLLIVSLINMSRKIDSDNIYLRSGMYEVLFNVEHFILRVRNSMTDVFINNKNIEELEARLEEAEAEILYYKELSRLSAYQRQENDHLKRMLEMRTQMRYSAFYAKVLFRDPSMLAEYLIIDKGRNSGFRINMPVVISGDDADRLTLIGKIVEVGGDYSRVQVITAKNFYVGAKTLDTGYIGVLKGQGSWNQNLALNYIPVESRTTIGEPVVTSGESEIYPEGLYIGEITGIGQNVMEEFFKTLYVQSDFQYSKVTEVFVLDYVNDHPDMNLECVYERF